MSATPPNDATRATEAVGRIIASDDDGTSAGASTIDSAGTRSPANAAATATAAKPNLWNSIGWATAGRGINAVLSFLLMLLASRALPASQFGEYLIFLFAAGGFALLSQCGLGPVIARRAAAARQSGEPITTAAQRQKASQLYSQALWLSVAAIVLLAAAHQLGIGSWLQMHLVEGGSSEPLLASLWLPVFFGLQGLAILSGELLKADGQINRYSQSLLILAPATALILALGACLAGAANAAMFVAAGCVAYGASTLYAATHLLSWRTLKPEPAILKTLPAESSPILGNAIFAFGCAQMDLLFVALFFSVEHVALYGFAVRTVQFLLLPLHIAYGFATPFLADLLQQRPERLSQFCQQLSGACLLLSAMSCMVIVAAYPWLFAGVNQGMELTGLLVLGLLMAGQLVNAATSVSSVTLEIAGFGRIALTVNALVVAASAAAFWAVNSMAGLVGFAIIAALMKVALNSGMALANWRFLHIRVAASRRGITEAVLLTHQRLMPKEC